MDTTTPRETFIAWNDELGHVPVRVERYGAVTVDDRALVDMIRATAGPDGLGQYLDAPDVIATVLGLASLPREDDGRRDITPMLDAPSMMETDATGAEV